MFIIRNMAFSNRALIKTWYYRLLLFNGQCSLQIDRGTERVILGFLCQMEGRGFLYPGQWKDLWHTYRMLPIWSSGKKKQPLIWVTPFFAFLIPFASFPSQESINILDRETAAFINSRRRERSRFWSFLSFWSRCEPFSPLAAYIRQTKRQIQRLKQKYLGALFLCALLLLC